MRVILVFLFLLHTILNAQSVVLTQEEQEFLKNNPIIKIGTLKEFYPYDIINENNKYDGFNADIIKAINRLTGANLIAFPFDNWSDVYQKAIHAQLHGIIGLSWSKQREEKYFHYTEPYHYSPYSVIVHKSNNSIKTFDDIKDKRILVRSESIVESIIKKHIENPNLIYCDSIDEIYQKMNSNEGDVFLDVNLEIDILKKNNLKIVTEIYDKAGELYIGIHHKYSLLRSIINKGLEAIPLQELKELRNRWFNKNNLVENSLFNKIQKKYIAKKDKIKICSIEYKPYLFKKEDKIVGISADIYEQYSKTLGIPFEIILQNSHKDCIEMLDKNEVDISDGHGYTIGKLETKSYLDDFFVLVTDYKQAYIEDFADLKDVTITISDHFLPLLNKFKKLYPKIKFRVVSDYDKALKNVLNKQVFGHIDLHKTIAWMIKNNYLGELKISGVLDDYNLKKVFELNTNKNSFILQSILNRLIHNMPQSKIREISNSWINVVFQTGFDFIFVLQIIIFFLLVVIVILYLNYQLNRRVKAQIEKYEVQQKMLFQQTKLASMGEMLNNIAHQWRQPLNRINSNVAVISLINKDDRINQKIRDIERNTKYMSETIDDFSNFFQPDKKKEKFSIVDAVYKANNLLKTRLKSIYLDIEYEDDIEVEGFEKEFIQVVITIMNNALDNFEIKHIQSPSIKITIQNSKEYVKVSIHDNGGGIPEEYLEKVFDPYFTTKIHHDGKGVGLYMSKMICENSMDGFLSVKNQNNGALFLIQIQK